MVLDRYLVQISAGLVVAIRLVSDWVGLPIGEGAEGALTMFVGCAWIKARSDNKWRALEMEREEMRDLLERLESTTPGSPEALQVRRDLVALARRADQGGDDA